jgi:hypothetical protein
MDISTKQGIGLFHRNLDGQVERQKGSADCVKKRQERQKGSIHAS